MTCVYRNSWSAWIPLHQAERGTGGAGFRRGLFEAVGRVPQPPTRTVCREGIGVADADAEVVFLCLLSLAKQGK
ncbi:MULTISPECIES: hypothetical protein [Deefgea]|uniref:Uncharacterized protein n=1 Tax=Deefgea chitinilytica TaxID=570276 RepID=A0ABS2CFS2_9NEIS|nr:MULTISPECIES: hypothetical protein [Deefgea]MBM5572987.1 hypothetical protein [Deefgea chitinilytica]MBM9890223.1 hypothetical protein [Deefgea sp. CFH1-16]